MSVFSIDRKVSSRPDIDADDDTYTAKLKRLNSLFQASEAVSLELFVLVSALLGPEYFDKLGPYLWSDLLDASNPAFLPPVCSRSLDVARPR